MQPPLDHVLRPDVVMVRHDEMRQQCLCRGFSDGRRFLLPDSATVAHDAVRPDRTEQTELPDLRRGGTAVGEVDDLARVARPRSPRAAKSTKLSSPSDCQW